MPTEQIIHDALALPTNAISYHVGQWLAERFPGQTVLEGGDGLFNVQEYARAGHCQLDDREIVHDQVLTHWRGREIALPWGMPAVAMRMMRMMSGLSLDGADAEGSGFGERLANAWVGVTWQEQTFDVVIMNWVDARGGPVYRYWIVSPEREPALRLVQAVCAWNAEIRGEVLVFDGGCWHKDAHLFEAIKGATYDNLILKGSLKDDLFSDLRQFFGARELYESHGIPWKRGILLVGPPGNGKTHAVKAILNAMEQPCLYVKTFRAEHTPDEVSIREVFERARKSAPCVLVLEDLDALVTPQNRSFFLNELDGFAANVGVVTLATTNHPERLDPAIVDRPSRFDRKYPFDLPAVEERLAYVRMWNASLKPALCLTEPGVAAVANETDAFSFAYLKELFLCSMMRWIARAEQGTMDEMMVGQIPVLRDQMSSARCVAPPPAGEAESIPGMPPGMMAGFMARRVRVIETG